MIEEKNTPILDSEISVKEKFKTLSTKKKVEFIYDYYKLPIIAVLLGIIILSYTVYSIATKQDTYCNITYYGSNADSEELSTIKDTLNEKILSDDKKSTIFIESIFVSPDSNYGDDPASTQAFAVKLAANEIDILLINKNYFNYFASQDMLLDLNSLPGFDSLNLTKNDLIMTKDHSGNEKLYGIKINNLNLLKDAIFDLDNTVLAIAISSQRNEQVLQVLKELTK